MLAEKQQALIADLNLIPDPHEKLSALAARKPPAFDPAWRRDENLVRGCVSRVWLAGEEHDGLCRFACDADSPMVKALAALLCDLYSGAPAAEVVAVEPELWDRCGLARQLTPTRLNGLAALRKRIRELATQFLAARQPPP
jgi:cysteine desulfuration protein SufE